MTITLRQLRELNEAINLENKARRINGLEPVEFESPEAALKYALDKSLIRLSLEGVA